nr:SRPBCC domain-containing protein [Hyphomonas sp. Mor2]
MIRTVLLTALGCSVGWMGAAQAEVISATPDHFTLKLEAETNLSPDEVWARLIDLPSWWLPDHTYSGDSDNLSIDPIAGGLWREDWEGGSVWHGSVLRAEPGNVLVLNAPFGPLQGLAVTSVWTISLDAQEDGGTRITFDHVTNGSAASGLDGMAPAVDYVKSEALKSLARPHDE